MNTVSIRDARRTVQDRRWIESIYRDYLNDLAPHATGLFPALKEFGYSEPEQLKRWFTDAGAQLLTIVYGTEPVGFAMVRTASQPGIAGSVEFSMAEFFISRPWRRRGIGQQAVRLILDRFTGRWEITEHERNPAAVDFWRRVVSGYTAGKYQERTANGEVYQRFDSGVQRKRD